MNKDKRQEKNKNGGVRVCVETECDSYGGQNRKDHNSYKRVWTLLLSM
jgi:hypothetical protein